MSVLFVCSLIPFNGESMVVQAFIHLILSPPLAEEASTTPTSYEAGQAVLQLTLFAQ